MRLIHIDIAGYKRFFDSTRLNTDGPLIALVGQNNAGKSSVLRAINRFNDDRSIGAEQTRRQDIGDDAEAVIAHYLLDKHDLERVNELLKGQSLTPRWLRVAKLMSGEIEKEVCPAPIRNLASRRALGKRFRAVLPEDGQFLDGDGTVVAGAPITESVVEALDSEDEELRPALIDQVEALGSIVRPIGHEQLADELETLVEVERGPLLRDRVAEVLYLWAPQFVFFDEDEREIEGRYDLDQHAHDPPPALRNFAALAKLNLIALRDAKAKADTGLVKQILAAANANLKAAFADWSQFPMAISIDDEDAGEIRLLVEEPDGSFTDFDDHSDGFQMFTGLVARIMTADQTVPPIVLIDEIETHLHYDAEADLLRQIGTELQVDRVIYSTHSIGCLPPDIGTGVRVVRRVGDTSFSEIDNHLWRTDAGIDPLLYAVGATTLSFIPLRDALLTEGPSELLVLPTLLREAMELRVLPFQVLPGVAQAPPERIAGLATSAPRVAWMVDNDKGGRAHAAKIRKRVNPDTVLVLSEGVQELALEDLVDPKVYLRAVNTSLSRYSEKEMPAGALARTMRTHSVKSWCKAEGLTEPSKIVVCHDLLEQRAEHQILHESRRKLVRGLYRRICKALDAARDASAA